MRHAGSPLPPSPPCANRSRAGTVPAPFRITLRSWTRVRKSSTLSIADWERSRIGPTRGGAGRARQPSPFSGVFGATHGAGSRGADSSDGRPFRADELHGHPDSLHVAVACRERFGSAEDEIDPGCLGIPNAALEQGVLEPASAERWIGCCVRKITNPVREIESCGGGRLPIHPR